MIIEKEKIIAVRVGEDICCMECVTDEELKSAEYDDFITEDDRNLEDCLVWCDRNSAHRIA